MYLREKIEKPDSLSRGAWHGHIVFAQWLVQVLKPKVFVELGTHYGDSYFSFCQAVKSNKLKTKCYAVDTWEGDPQAGFYDETVYNYVHKHNEEKYKKFSKLHKMLFDDAVSKFDDKSIDLLHIDGFHSYESVRHDFETWLPKLGDNAVVIFHDTAETQKGFGVCYYWDELTQKYPSNHFLFTHSHGLGVLGIGKEYPSEIKALFSAKGNGIEQYRKLFSRINTVITEPAEQELKIRKNNALKIYIDSGNGFSGNESETTDFYSPEGRGKFFLTQFKNIKRIRLDLGRLPLFIQISNLMLKTNNGTEVIPNLKTGNYSEIIEVPSREDNNPMSMFLLFSKQKPQLVFDLPADEYEAFSFNYRVFGYHDLVDSFRISELENTISEKEKAENDNKKVFDNYKEEIAELKEKLVNAEENAANYRKTIESKSLEIKEKDKTIDLKNLVINQKDDEIESINNQLESRNLEIQKKDIEIEKIKVEIAEKNDVLLSKDMEIVRKNNEIKEKDTVVLEKNKEIERKEHELSIKNTDIESKMELLDNKNKEINTKNKEINEYKLKNEKLNNMLKYKKEKIIKKEKEIMDIKGILNLKLNSVENNLSLLIKKERQKAVKKYKKRAMLRRIKRIGGFVVHPKTSLRYMRDKKILLGNNFFDEKYYLSQDVSLYLVPNLIRHFLLKGWKEGKNPNPLFDVKHYLKVYPDVKKSGMNPVVHYLRYGVKEGRNPHPLFDTKYYLKTYPDVRKSGMNPVVHYMRYGVKEGRNPHPLFDTKYYFKIYPDVKKSGMNPLVHYMRYGAKEGRNPHPLFDTKYYYDAYPDVRKNGINPVFHYMRYGAKEGRNPHPLFDTKFYLKTYPDVKRSRMNPLVHYMRYGVKEGRNPHPLFDTKYYYNAYPDVKKSEINALSHYLQYGVKEGRNPHPLFDAKYYFDTYPDVRKSGMNPVVNYMQYGAKEGRNPHPLFDTKYYFDTYPDVRKSGMNPLVHFMQYGAKEGRNPHLLFNIRFYRDTYLGELDDGDNPLISFIQYGWKEGKNPNLFFDTEYYLAENLDVKRDGINPIIHFCEIGWKEKRNPSPFFHIKDYFELYPDVRDSGANPLIHYIKYGKKEFRFPNKSEYYIKLIKSSGLFDREFYSKEIEKNECVIKQDDFEKHYIVDGYKMGLNPNSNFDSQFYLNFHKNEIHKEIHPFIHYLKIGQRNGYIINEKELLINNIFFDEKYYLDQYNLKTHNINETIDHFLEVGWLKNYSPCKYLDIEYYKKSNFNINEIMNPLVSYAYSVYEFENTWGKEQKDLHLVLDDGFPKIQKNPKVSIVIPVYNKLYYTLQCLNSIYLHYDDEINLEIIIVDDCSSDLSSGVLKKIKNIVYIRNENNKGFLHSSNIGAATAKGEYLLFLNNDTEVKKDWVKSMLKLFLNDDRIGIVGSKLVYPDGRLQEAGAVYWNDATGLNYGRGDSNPDKPQYNYVRNVDKCSGASLLIKNEVFMNVGGFDDRFAPAYKEDADLCFQVRYKGYKVMYQPLSEVIHYEGVSCGTDINSGIKKYQVINQPKFVKKWNKYLLANHYPNNRENVFLARERPKEKKIILVIDDKVPEYDKHAGAMGMFHYIELFNEIGYKVIFVPDNKRKIEPYTGIIQQMGIEVYYGSFKIEDLIRKIGKYIDLVWLSRPNESIKYIGIIREMTNAKIIYCGRDLHFLRKERQYNINMKIQTLQESVKYETIETKLFALSDIVFVFSEYEKTIMESKIINSEKIKIISPYIFPKEDLRIPELDVKSRNDIVFIGSGRHAPNSNAIIWFIENCWENIKKAIPYSRLVLIGSDQPQSILEFNSEDIVVAGFVEDLNEYFQNARVAIAPLQFGAGVKGKIISSFQYGIPVVATRVGAEGMSLENNKNIVIANSPNEYAKAVISLFEDDILWQKISSGCLQYMIEKYDKSAVLDTLKKHLKGIGFDL